MGFKFDMGQTVRFRSRAGLDKPDKKGVVISRVRIFENNPHAPDDLRKLSGGPWYWITGGGRYIIESDLEAFAPESLQDLFGAPAHPEVKA